MTSPANLPLTVDYVVKYFFSCRLDYFNSLLYGTTVPSKVLPVVAERAKTFPCVPD